MDKSQELALSGLVYPLVKELLLPKIKLLVEKIKIDPTTSRDIENSFEIYLRQRYEKYSVIDTLVFPNKQTDLRILYEPLTVLNYNREEEVSSILIDGYPDDFLPEYMRVAIEDTAGMGKSTISKKIFLSIIEKQAAIPMLIELRRINHNNTFLTEIQSQLSGFGTEISSNIILQLLNEGGFVFLFDGFDEIANKDKDFVITDLHEFIDKANDNLFLITSRKENLLASFGDFQTFSIKPLDEQEAFSLITRYDHYSYKPIAKDLISALTNSKDGSFKEFLKNPFLVSLLYKSFEFKKDIPNKKTQFYRQVFDALFESHDLSKEGYFKRDKFSNLHLDDFETVLRYISFLTSKENEVEYEKDYIIKIIDMAKEYVPEFKFKSSDYLRDLTETVPLFQKDGTSYRWAHKSLQDYFTAKFIWIDAREKQEPILRKIYEDPTNARFYNVLDLFHELDPKTFELTLVKWFLEDYEIYYKSLDWVRDVDKKHIKDRLEKTFGLEKVGFVVGIDIDKNQPEETIEEAIDMYVDKIFRDHLPEHELTMLFLHDFVNSATTVFSFEKRSSKDTIMSLLEHKRFDFVKYNDLPKIDDAIVNLERDQVYKIDSDKENIVNSKAYFEAANSLLSSEKHIDSVIALKRLEEIKAIVNTNLNDELLSW